MLSVRRNVRILSRAFWNKARSEVVRKPHTSVWKLRFLPFEAPFSASYAPVENSRSGQKMKIFPFSNSLESCHQLSLTPSVSGRIFSSSRASSALVSRASPARVRSFSCGRRKNPGLIDSQAEQESAEQAVERVPEKLDQVMGGVAEVGNDDRDEAGQATGGKNAERKRWRAVGLMLCDRFGHIAPKKRRCLWREEPPPSHLWECREDCGAGSAGSL